MKEERKLTFGKYKGQDIKYIILTHIGYIMWCFDNIDWFKLTDEEQALYDAIAIMIKKEHLPMTFPVEMMYKHVKDRESYEKLKTPFTFNYGYISLKMSERIIQYSTVLKNTLHTKYAEIVHKNIHHSKVFQEI